MFAIIETGGKQYLVEPGKKIRVEKLEAAEGETITFDKVLLVFGGKKTDIGAPQVDGALVSAKVLRHGREPKKIVFRYKAKVRRRKMKGHRQPFTELEITAVK